MANPFAMDVESAPRTQPTMATNLNASHRVCPPLKLKPCQLRTSPRLGHASVPRNGREPREQEAWEGKTFSPSLMAHCVVSKGPRSIRRNDAPNTMGRCVCSMPLGSLTVARVPCASTVKDMASPPKNLVVSALSCIHCRRGHQKSSRRRAVLPLPLLLILFSGVIGRAVSLAEPGYGGNGAIWSWYKPHPFHHLSRRLHLSRALNERIGA